MITPERILHLPETSPETFSRRLRRAAADALVYGNSLVIPIIGIAIFGPDEMRSYLPQQLMEITNLLRDDLPRLTLIEGGIFITSFGTAFLLDRD